MKKFTKIALALFVAFTASYGVYTSQQKTELSEVALSNIEALAHGEDNCHYQNGVTNIQLEPTMWNTTLHRYYDCCAIQVDGYDYDSKCN